MIRVMIVDDEAIARMGLIRAIDWEENGYLIVGEAGDLASARSIAISQKPDIILVDIILRDESGLDFIEGIHDCLPLAKFIIVSCTDNSGFYRKAISLRVSEYISKASITPRELLEKLDRVTQEIRRERLIESSDTAYDSDLVNRYAVLNSYLSRVLSKGEADASELSKRLMDFGVQVMRPGFALLVMQLREQKLKQEVESGVIGMCYEILSGMGQGYVFQDNPGNLVMLITDPDREISAQCQRDLSYRLITTVYECFDIRMVIGASMWQKGLSGFVEAYRQALRACEQSFINPNSNIALFQPEEDAARCFSRVREQMEAIGRIRRSEDFPLLAESLEAILDLFKANPGCSKRLVQDTYLEVLYHMLGVTALSQAEVQEFLEPDAHPARLVEGKNSLDSLHTAMLALLERLKNQFGSAPGDPTVRTIENYVKKNIDKGVTLQVLSDLVHFTPAYISRYYKRRTGKNLKDFITECKICRAQEMLSRGEALSDVAEKLNFCSASHFIQVFKARLGMTPREFLTQDKA